MTDSGNPYDGHILSAKQQAAQALDQRNAEVSRIEATIESARAEWERHGQQIAEIARKHEVRTVSVNFSSSRGGSDWQQMPAWEVPNGAKTSEDYYETGSWLLGRKGYWGFLKAVRRGSEPPTYAFVPTPLARSQKGRYAPLSSDSPRMIETNYLGLVIHPDGGLWVVQDWGKTHTPLAQVLAESVSSWIANPAWRSNPTMLRIHDPW